MRAPRTPYCTQKPYFTQKDLLHPETHAAPRNRFSLTISSNTIVWGRRPWLWLTGTTLPVVSAPTPARGAFRSIGTKVGLFQWSGSMGE